VSTTGYRRRSLGGGVVSTGAKDRFKRAEQAAKKGNYEYAIELYLQGLILDPKARERRRLHEVESQAVQEHGGNPEGSFGAKMKVVPFLANAKRAGMQKKWDEVVLELEKAIRYQPRNPSLLLQLASALTKIEADDSALDVFEEVVGYDHHNVDALRGLGALHGKREEIEKAVEYWEKVRMLKPDDKEAAKAIRDLSAANMVKRAEDRKKVAGDDSFKAMLKDEGESSELEKKAKVIRNDEDRREAIQFKLADLRKEPTNSRLWRELAGLYADLREYKHAIAAYKKAQEVNPHDLFARDKLDALRELIAKEQLDAFRAKVLATGENGESHELQQQLEEKEKEFLRLRAQIYEERVKNQPTDMHLKLEYGKILMQLGGYDAAIEQLQKAVKDPKIRTQAQNYMGLCFLSKGVHAVAITQFKDALTGESDADSDRAKEYRYNLAVAHEENGDIPSALQLLQEIMAVDIGYRDVSTRVSRLMK
jgi:tetratricopeptide (TPR) repeat protein